MLLDGTLRQLPFDGLRLRLLVVVPMALLMSVLLAGCSISASSESGWNFWSRGGLHKSVTGFSTESEYKTVQLSAGDTLTVDYDVAVNRGELAVSVDYPVLSGGGSIWRQDFDSDENGSARVEVPHSGPYEIRVRMMRFGGRYDISWDVE